MSKSIPTAEREATSKDSAGIVGRRKLRSRNQKNQAVSDAGRTTVVRVDTDSLVRERPARQEI